MTSITIKPFDYSALDHDLADDACTTASRIRERLQKGIYDTGHDLIARKKIYPTAGLETG